MEKKAECVVVGAIETNCWLYPLGNESAGRRHCVVIDPGDEAPKIINRLKELGWLPRYILLTHGHFDHVAALPGLLDAFWKDLANSDGGGNESSPEIGIHRLDAHYLGKDALAVHNQSIIAAGGSPAYLESIMRPLPNADTLFEEGDTVGPFKVLHLPGHTAGSVGFYDEEAGILFSGDTLFKADYGRTDLPGGNEEDLIKSLKRLLTLNGEVKVYPGHGATTIIKEEQNLF